MKKRYIVMILIIILLVFVDQLTKILVNNNFADTQVLIKNVITIEKVENEGFAFGHNKENVQNIILSIFVIIFIIKYLMKHEKHINKLVLVCMSMIIA